MLKIGITGGIGSGKTTACRLFEALGAPVYYADDRAKALMVSEPALIAGLKALLGEAAYTPEGALNRPFIASQIFADAQLKQAVDALVHPAVALDGERWQAEQAAKGLPYTLKEAALLFEAGSYRALDKIVVVSAPEALRLERVQNRDGISPEAALQRLRSQMPQEEKEARADYILQNTDLDSLKAQVLALHELWTSGKPL